LSVQNEPSNIVYVDLDDVLCQAARHFLLIVEREFGKRIEYEQLTTFDVGHACRLRPEEREELYRIVHRPEELSRMTPIPEALEVLRRWENAGFEIGIVTGRPISNPAFSHLRSTSSASGIVVIRDNSSARWTIR